MELPETPSKAYDSVVYVGMLLHGFHWIFGIVSSVCLLTFLPTQHLNNAFASGAGIVAIARCIFGWAPYLVSWFYSRSVLEGNRRGAVAFAIGGIAISGLAVASYQNKFGFQVRPSQLLISVLTMLGLIGLAKLCSAIWTVSWKS
jgi:hypothetical protein